MSLYSYAPDKETLLELMVDHVSGELTAADPPSGDWRTDLKTIAHLQRAHMLRHPWLPAALSTRRVPGPNTLAFLEHALAALRPTGLDGAAKLEVFAQLTAFVAGHVAHEITQAAAARSPDRGAAEARYLAAVAADGRHPELAEVLAAPGRPLTAEATFARFLGRLIDGLDAGFDAAHPRARPSACLREARWARKVSPPCPLFRQGCRARRPGPRRPGSAPRCSTRRRRHCGGGPPGEAA